ncbi:hypothetical protein O9992_06225 [Vibrio lentus]|nr:hypothetical protein [Vibrio lentus]
MIEAFEIWNKKVGIPADKIVRIGGQRRRKKFESDNFGQWVTPVLWSMYWKSSRSR